METKTMIRTVQKQDLASSMKSGALDVLATPRMICWMEELACDCLKLPEGMTSVGTQIDVVHLAPSALGAEIEIQADLLEKSEKKALFEVRAYCGNTCIGKGTHKRAIVNVERFLSRLENGKN